MNRPSILGLDRIFVLLIVAAAGGLSSSSATGEDGRAEAVVAFIAEQRDEAPVLDLLELHLLEHEGIVAVDRERIDDILREHALATLLGAEHADNRVRVGRLLGCDLLLIARVVQEPQPHVRLAFSDTQMGVRFRNVTLGLQDQGPKIFEDLDRYLDLALGKLRSPQRAIVAVPPFISHDLSRDHEHLQAALARIVEQALLPRREVVVVEFDEARAIARETQLVGKQISRPDPFYLVGEFRLEASNAEARPFAKVTLRHGNTDLAERQRLDLSADDIGRFVLEAALGLAGRIADLPQTPQKPADEASALAARAEAFWRVGSYADGITMAEASLLLEPNQPEIRSETTRAYTVLSRLQYDDPRMSKERFDRQVAEALRLSRLACQHAEQYYLATDFKTSRSRGCSTGDLSWFFHHRHSDDRIKSAITAHIRGVRDMFRRVTEIRHRQGRTDSAFLSAVLGYTMGSRSLSGETLAECLQYRHRIIPMVPDHSPNLLYQIFEHDLPASVREDPETLAFYRSYVDSDRWFVAQIARRAMRAHTKPVEQTRVEPALGTTTLPAKAEREQRTSSWRATFTVVGTDYEDEHGQRHTFQTQGILPVAAGVDVAWGFYGPRVVFVVPEPGKFEKIFEADKQHSFGGGCFDGRYVWLPLGGPNTRLLRIDPRLKTVFEVTSAHGLPTGHPYLAATCPLEPGKIALAATFGQQFAQRSFVAIVEAREVNIANVSIIHESREPMPQSRDYTEPLRNNRLAFLPKFMLPLKDENSELVRRIVIGRSVADPVSKNPSLVIDLPTRTASIVKAGTPSHLTQGDFTIHNGAAYWTASQEFVRLGPQDFDAVATLTSLPEQHAAVLFHHERIFFIGRGCWVTDDPSKPPEEVHANVRWDRPRLHRLFLSENYGPLLYAVQGDGKLYRIQFESPSQPLEAPTR